MLKTLNILLTIRISSAVNRFIYYVQKLPLVGKLVKDNLYSQMEMKKSVAIIVLLLSLVWGFLSRIVYIGLLIYLPVVEFSRSLHLEAQLELFVHILILLSFVVAGVSSAVILVPKREKYIAVKLMRLNPTRYMHASLCYRYSMFLFYLTPAILLFTHLLGASIMQGVLLTAALTLWRVFSEYLHLKLFDKTGMVLVKNNPLVWSVILVGFTVAYLPLFIELAPTSGLMLLGWPTLIMIGIAGVFATIRLAGYSNYRRAVDASTQRDDPLLNIGRMMTDAQKNSVQTKESDYTSETAANEKFNTKIGYAYLNSIFFTRHRSIIIQPVYKRLAIIGVLGIVGIVIAMFYDPLTPFLRSNLGILLPFLVLVMSYLSVGERICKAMFYHCDLSLIRYSFYRRAVEEHFRIRLYQIAGLNLMIAAALATVLTLITIAAGGSLFDKDMLFVWVCVLLLSLFFSVHHLFMYYIFQPFTTEMNVKNPLYFVVNIGVSIASGLCIIVRAPSHIFTIIVLIITLLYLLIALFLVRMHGRHTFRVR